MDPGATITLQRREIIDPAGLDVIQSHSPGEDAKGELECLWGDANDELPVIHDVEREDHEENEKDHCGTSQTGGSYPPGE